MEVRRKLPNPLIPPLDVNKTPEYWHLLTEKDKERYCALKLAFTPGELLSSRIASNQTFVQILTIIRQYAERGDSDDWKRFLVCGICWLDDGIAINTRQLTLLLSKCKSSINGSFQKIGYKANTTYTESGKTLFPKIPFLRQQTDDLRKWSIRRRVLPVPHPLENFVHNVN